MKLFMSLLFSYGVEKIKEHKTKILFYLPPSYAILLTEINGTLSDPRTKI